MFALTRQVTARRAKSSITQWLCPSCRCTYSDTASPTPPLLLKLRNDLKTAMRAKDTNRLNVLKSLLADVTNASKTSNPITSDMQLLSLLRKRSTAAKAAGEEFKAAGRVDLVEKEQGQASILDEYASGVDTMSVGDLTQAVKDLVMELRSQTPDIRAGDVMKALFKVGGILDGKPVDKKLVPGILKEVMASS